MDIREFMKESNVFTWQLAEKLGVHENTVYRLLRKELPTQKKLEILQVITEIKTTQSI